MLENLKQFVHEPILPLSKLDDLRANMWRLKENKKKNRRRAKAEQTQLDVQIDNN